MKGRIIINNNTPNSAYSEKLNNVNHAPIMFEDFPDIMNVADVQQALHIGKNTTYKLIDNKELKSICIGRNIRVPKMYLIDFVMGVKQEVQDIQQ